MLAMVPSRSPWPGPRPSASAELLIAVGTAGLIARTEDSGDHWTEVTSGVTVQLNSAAYGAGVWIVVGESGTILISSDDGKTWKPTPSPVATNIGINAVEFSGDVFVIFARGTTATTRFWWSLDGITWVNQSSPYGQAGTIGWSSGSANGVFVFSQVSNYQYGLTLRTPHHKDGAYIGLPMADFSGSYYGVYGATINEDGQIGLVGQATKLGVGLYTAGHITQVYTGGGDSRVWNDAFYDKKRGMWAMCGGSNQIAGGNAIAQALVKDTYAQVTVGGSAANIVAALGAFPANCLTATAKRCFIGGLSGKIAGAANWNEPFTTLATFSRKVYCIKPAVSS